MVGQTSPSFPLPVGEGCSLPPLSLRERGRERGIGDTAIPAGETPLLAVADLQVHFPIRRGLLQRAVGAVRRNGASSRKSFRATS